MLTQLLAAALADEHGKGHRDQAPRGAAVAVTALAQFCIAGTAKFGALNGDARSVVDGAEQPQAAGLAHDHDAALAAAVGYRDDTGFNGNYLKADFRIGSDGNCGTDITLASAAEASVTFPGDFGRTPSPLYQRGA